jgi:hypothetical protein
MRKVCIFSLIFFLFVENLLYSSAAIIMSILVIAALRFAVDIAMSEF